MKIVFYNFGGVKNFVIKSNDFSIQLFLREWEEYVLPFFDCDNLIVECDGEIFDFTNQINKIGYNELIIND
jgi:hypothetical protein